MGLSLTPFITNLWGGIGPQAEKMCNQLLKVVLGHSEGWLRVQRAMEFQQRLSLSIMAAVGRQLRAVEAVKGEASLMENTAAGEAHQPYA